MTGTSNLDCKIYVDTEISRDKLIQKVVNLLDGAVKTNTISVQGIEIDILKNDEFDLIRRKEFPDGFLYFRYCIEFYDSSEDTIEERVVLVSKVLEYLWLEHIPAVAASDYEKQLPDGGGYKKRFTWDKP